jgi:hypothetical protein
MDFDAACGCVLSPEREDLPPCAACDACEAHCLCCCERCGTPLHALDDCPACLQEPDMGDDVDHTEGVLGDLDEQVREWS